MNTGRMTRRAALVSTGALISSRAGFATAAQPSTAVNFEIPAGACDCHTHIFGDPKKFRLFSGRTYTPEMATPEEMSALHRALHIERVVIVTPSVYGTDNSATLYGMKARSGAARGIAVIDEKTPDRDLDAMNRAGFRGIRINLGTAGADATLARRRFQASVDRVKKLNWHIQIYAAPAVISRLKDLVLTSPVPVVFDHFGGTQAAGGLQQPGFVDLIEMVKSGKAYVKISGAYHLSTQAPDYPDAAPFARALIAANPDRILRGTDWPHPNSTTPEGHSPQEVTALFQIDDGMLLNQLAVWAPEPGMRNKILVENPAKLYGF